MYWYLSPDFQEFIRSRTVSGSTVERIPLTDFPSYPVRLPPMPEQNAIAELLGALDDKIELNRKTAASLEQMALALFTLWFTSNVSDYTTAAGLTQAGILEIGDGYRAKNSELASDGLPFVRAGNLNGGFNTATADRLSWASVAKAGDKVSRFGDVAFTSKGTIGRLARVSSDTAKFVYSPQVCYWRSLSADQLHPAIMYCWMQTADFRSQIAAVSDQTDMAPYVSLRDQRRMAMPVFPESQASMAETIEPLLALSAARTAESRTLATLRATLLPKFFSGECRIAGGTSAAEAVA